MKTCINTFSSFSQRDSAFKYLQLANKERAFFTKKTISNLAAFQQVLLDRQLKLKDLQREEIEKQGRVRMYVLIATLLVFLGFGAVLLYNYLQKKKANFLLAAQKEEIETTFTKTQIDPKSTHTIRKASLTWRTYRRHCPRNTKPVKLRQ